MLCGCSFFNKADIKLIRLIFHSIKNSILSEKTRLRLQVLILILLEAAISSLDYIMYIDIKFYNRTLNIY